MYYLLLKNRVLSIPTALSLKIKVNFINSKIADLVIVCEAQRRMYLKDLQELALNIS